MNVTDAKGNGIAQGITFTVSGLEVSLEKTAPSGNSIVFGSPASFAANLMAMASALDEIQRAFK